MKSDGSLPQSQEPTACPYPEPNQSSPRLLTHVLKIHFNNIIIFTFRFSKCPLSIRSYHQNLECTSPVSHTWHIIIFIFRYGYLLSQTFSSWHFSSTSGDRHRSGFKLHTAVLSVLCVMFQV